MPHEDQTDRESLNAALLTNLDAHTFYRGEVTMPCLPAALPHYLECLEGLFKLLGKPLTDPEREQLRRTLSENLDYGYRVSPVARLVVEYRIPVQANVLKDLACKVAVDPRSLADEYAQRSESKERPLFGAHPDARVIALANALLPPARFPILDVGAGTGRNALPLARRGYPVDALEPAAHFAVQMRAAASAEHLPLTIIEGNILDPQLPLSANRYALAIVSEVASHFRDRGELRTLLVRLAEAVVPGGHLLVNLFLAKDGYEPDELARQVSQMAWASLFTRGELEEALAGLPWQLTADDGVLAYEKAHLPSDAWPPTPWYGSWVTGKSIFPMAGLPPVDFRWLLLQKEETESASLTPAPDPAPDRNPP